MSYLLDTNACIAAIRGQPIALRARLRDALAAGQAVAVPTIALFELWYGVAKSQSQERNSERLAVFLAPLEIEDFDADAAERAGQIRAALERDGRPIGAYDILIAGQALRHGHTLITANAAEFDRVPGLAWQNWAA